MPDVMAEEGIVDSLDINLGLAINIFNYGYKVTCIRLALNIQDVTQSLLARVRKALEIVQ